jgi:hypothetical protein
MTILEYIEALPYEQQTKYLEVYNSITSLLLDLGFELRMQYNMPTFVVPLHIHPEGYLKNKEVPLPYISLAAQKRYLSLYHMGLYAMPDELEEFIETYEQKVGKKPNMGKSCIRHSYNQSFPVDILQQIVSILTPEEFASMHRTSKQPS